MKQAIQAKQVMLCLILLSKLKKALKSAFYLGYYLSKSAIKIFTFNFLGDQQACALANVYTNIRTHIHINNSSFCNANIC